MAGQLLGEGWGQVDGKQLVVLSPTIVPLCLKVPKACGHNSYRCSRSSSSCVVPEPGGSPAGTADFPCGEFIHDFLGFGLQTHNPPVINSQVQW